MATATLTFDQDSYAPGDTIRFTVLVDVPMVAASTVNGSVELPDGTLLPAQSTTTIHGVYGPFTADGYTIVADAADASKFVATPAGG